MKECEKWPTVHLNLSFKNYLFLQPVILICVSNHLYLIVNIVDNNQAVDILIKTPYFIL